MAVSNAIVLLFIVWLESDVARLQQQLQQRNDLQAEQHVHQQSQALVKERQQLQELQQQWLQVQKSQMEELEGQQQELDQTFRFNGDKHRWNNSNTKTKNNGFAWNRNIKDGKNGSRKNNKRWRNARIRHEKTIVGVAKLEATLQEQECPL
jgi:hypothetical protein